MAGCSRLAEGQAVGSTADHTGSEQKVTFASEHAADTEAEATGTEP